MCRQIDLKWQVNSRVTNRVKCVGRAKEIKRRKAIEGFFAYTEQVVGVILPKAGGQTE